MPAMDLTGHWAGITSVVIFVVAYGAVMAEEQLHLRKSQPALISAGAIWLLVGIAFALAGASEAAADAARHNLLEYGELFLFLLVAMTFVNTMEERGVFDALRAWLVGRGFSLRTLFWVTGALAFVMSPVADNLTTALVLGSVAISVGRGRPKFITLACINIVVAANAGGAFSPFGDITTLMVWQAGIVSFFEFFRLLLPSAVNWLVTALLMAFAVEHGLPAPVRERPALESGAVTVVLLFAGTIGLTVMFHNFLDLPAAIGMMTGLGILKIYSYGFNRLAGHHRVIPAGGDDELINELDNVFASLEREEPRAERTVKMRERVARRRKEVLEAVRLRRKSKPLDIFERMEKIEWDTLMFFYGVILSVGGLGALGYLALASRGLYTGIGATGANLLVGIISAIVDNVPVMFAVLSMNPEMSHGQWLLVTLTAGVGGSLLSIGSAAGVALMGQARDSYTFLAHLRWSWAIALGFAASVGTHLLINRHLF
ncbi:MAG: sodium:proton antiporter NhaD [Chloroflexi bacterium]|nr:sodium:proton antiporter NhaD [Chloroflexota bacterium]